MSRGQRFRCCRALLPAWVPPLWLALLTAGPCWGQTGGELRANGNAPAAASEAAGDAGAPGTPPAAPPPAAAASRTSLNLLGEVDTDSGEGRRNENVRITLINNNVLKELNVRLGTTATIFEEFEVDHRYFGKEFGGDPVAPLHISGSTASGVHGELYWSHNNSIFSARSFFQAGDVQPARSNEYGFRVQFPVWEGGSLLLDGGQDRQRGQVNGNVLAPRPDERTPLATDPATRAIVARILAAYPEEPPNRTDIDPRALNTNDQQNIDNDRIAATWDQSWRDRDRFTMRYSFTGQQVEAFQLVGGQNPDTTTKNHQARITWNRTWNARTITDVSVGFNRVGSLLVPEETSVGPLILTGFVVEFLGPGSDIPIDRAQNEFRYAARLRKIAGKHTLTSGFEIVRRQVNGFEAETHRGLFSFRDDFGRDAITNIRLGTPSNYRLAIGSAHRGFRNWDMQWYAGDDWKASSRLNLNLGLRYQPVTRPVEVNGLTAIPYDCDCNNLAPTFGFAYRLGGGWGLVRGAYGLHYGEIFPVTFGQARFNPPHLIQVTVNQPDLADPLKNLTEADFRPDARSVIFRLDPELATPYSHQYNVSWQLELARDWGLELGYVGSRSPKLLQKWYLNRARPVEGIPQTTKTINERRPDPRYFDIQHVLNGSLGYYDAGKVTLTVPQWAGLSLEGSYWWSKAIDLGSEYTNTAAGRDGRRSRSPSEFDAHGEMKGLSSFDQPHAMLWRIHYETPALRRAHGWMRKIFGSWQISSVALWKSGTPFDISSGSDGPGSGNVDGASSDRPHILDPSILGRTIDHPDTSAARLPRGAFAFIEPTERAGNLGNNTFRKDAIWNLNQSLSRRWALGADRSLLFQAESLNFLNHPQFAEPGRQLTSPNFGRITNTLNDGRTFRFSLRFSF